MNNASKIKRKFGNAVLFPAILVTMNGFADQNSNIDQDAFTEQNSFTSQNFLAISSEIKSFYAGDFSEHPGTQERIGVIELLNKKSSAFLRENGGNIVIVDGESKFSAKNIRAIMDAGNAIIVINETSAMRKIKPGVSGAPGAAMGYYVPASGPSASFYTGENDTVGATVLAYEWALKVVGESKEQPGTGFTRSPHPAFSSKHRRAWYSGDEYPKFNVFTQFWQLADDGDAERDFWVAQMNAELVPDGNFFGYRNRYIKQRMDISPIPGAVIDEYAPTASTSVVDATLSADGNPFDISYNLAHTTIDNHSDVSQGQVEWEHTIGWEFGAATDTMAVGPGLEFQTPDGTQEPWAKIDETASATFTTWFALDPFVTRSVEFDEQGEIWVGRRLVTEHHEPFTIRSKYHADRGEDKCLFYFDWGSFESFSMEDCAPGPFPSQQFQIREVLRDNEVRTDGDDHLAESYFQIETLNPLDDGLCMELKRDQIARMEPCDPNNPDQLLTLHRAAPGEFFRLETKGSSVKACFIHETADSPTYAASSTQCWPNVSRQRFFLENL